MGCLEVASRDCLIWPPTQSSTISNTTPTQPLLFLVQASKTPSKDKQTVPVLQYPPREKVIPLINRNLPKYSLYPVSPLTGSSTAGRGLTLSSLYLPFQVLKIDSISFPRHQIKPSILRLYLLAMVEALNTTLDSL